MSRVPQNSQGAARRAYHHGYSKSAQNRVSRTLGDNKLRTPKQSSGGSSRSSSSSSNKSEPKRQQMQVSFGRTGYVRDDFDG